MPLSIQSTLLDVVVFLSVNFLSVLVLHAASEVLFCFFFFGRSQLMSCNCRLDFFLFSFHFCRPNYYLLLLVDVWDMLQSWFCPHTMGQTLSEPKHREGDLKFRQPATSSYWVYQVCMQGWRTGILVVVIVFVVSQCFVVALWVLIMCLQSELPV